jgi:hypothetical protein
MWKVDIVRPIAKVGTPSGLSNFRSISIVSILSKAFERILHDQVLVHVNNRSLLSDFQSGFRRGNSSTTVLARVTEDLRFSMAEEKITVLSLLDFFKAFDMVNDLLFRHKLGSEYMTFILRLLGTWFLRFFKIVLWSLRSTFFVFWYAAGLYTA